MSSGLFPNSKNEMPYKNPILPADSYIVRDVGKNWGAFAPRPITGRVQTGSIMYGQKHVHDTPLNQPVAGSLYGFRLEPSTVNIPRAITIESNDELPATVDAPVKVEAQKGSGRTRATEHIAPHDLPRPFAFAKLIF